MGDLISGRHLVQDHIRMNYYCYHAMPGVLLTPLENRSSLYPGDAKLRM